MKIARIIQSKPEVLLHKALFKARKFFLSMIDRCPIADRYGEVELNCDIAYKTVNPPCKSPSDDIDLDDIINNRFFWLGMNGSIAEDAVWNKDFVSGKTWANDYFQNIKTVNIFEPGDVKIPWELSRLQHLSRLAILCANSNDGERISEFIRLQLQSWVNSNPYKHSVNWTCAMEVAIRAINMIFIALLIPNEIFKNTAEFEGFIRLQIKHGIYIWENLEVYDELRNNHYLSDLLGLQWISLFCLPYVRGRWKTILEKWYAFSICELDAECRVQIYPDGTDYESSTAYHRFVTELFCLSVYIDGVYGKRSNESIILTIQDMAHFLSELRMGDGHIPLVGDSDDGRVLILEDYSHWDRCSCDFLLERLQQYIQGDFSKPKADIQLHSDKSVWFRDGGYYIIRNDSLECFIHCGPLSLKGHGGHSHNDQLAAILSFGGVAFVIDSGTGCYSGDPNLRNLMRSTRCHSTVEAIGVEQNELDKNNLFMMPERTYSKCVDVRVDRFIGEHQGFKIVGLSHRREIELKDSELIIEDYIFGNPKPDQKWVIRYVLDSGVDVNRIDSHTVLMRKYNRVVRLECDIPITIENCVISKRYGETVESTMIKSVSNNKAAIQSRFSLEEG